MIIRLKPKKPSKIGIMKGKNLMPYRADLTLKAQFIRYLISALVYEFLANELPHLHH